MRNNSIYRISFYPPYFEKVIYHIVTRLSKRMLTKFILNEKTIFVREEIMEVMTANTEMTAVTYST